MPPTKVKSPASSKKKAATKSPTSTPSAKKSKPAQQPNKEPANDKRAQYKALWLTHPAVFVGDDDTVYEAFAITKPHGKDWTLKVKSIVDGSIFKTFTVNELSTGTAEGLKQIMPNFVGSVFDGEKDRVRVKELTKNDAGVAVVVFEVVQRDNSTAEPEEPAVPLTIDEFTKIYTAVPDRPSTDPGAYPFDFAYFPRLLRVLKAVGAFGTDDDATDMPCKQAVELMLAMRTTEQLSLPRSTSGECDVDRLAASLESTYAGPKASPELTRLHSVAATGACNGADFSQKGRLAKELALQVPISDAASPEGRPRPTAATPNAPAGRTAKSRGKETATPVDEEEIPDLVSNSDESSDESSDGDEDIPINPAKRAKAAAKAAEKAAAKAAAKASGAGSSKKRPKHRRAHFQEGEAEIHEMTDGDEEEVTQTSPGLGQLCPKGWTKLDVARIVFAEEQVRDVVKCQPVPASIPLADVAKLTTRFDLAYIRLINKIGMSWRPSHGKPARSMSQLEEWAEAILDLVAQDAHAFSSLGPQSHARPAEAVAAPHLTPSELAGAGAPKPADGLTGAKQAAAISPSVCQRLHEGNAELEAALARAKVKNPAAGPADVIGETPDSLRADLQRAATSNSLVDAPGETQPQRRSLTPFAHGMRRTIQRALEAAAHSVPKADTTGEMSLDAETAAAAAADVLEAKWTFDQFHKLARTSLGSGAAPVGSAAANVEAWSFLHPMLTALLANIAAPKAESAAVAQINTIVQAPPGIARLTPADVKDWIEKIARHYKGQKRDFLLHDGGFPLFQTAIEDQKDNFQWKSIKNSLASSQYAPNTITNGGHTSKRQAAAPPQSATRPKRAKPNPPNAGQAKPQTSAPGRATGTSGRSAPTQPTPASTPVGQSAWTERKVNLSNDKFAELKEAVKTRYADTCAFYLLAKCTRKGCVRKHARPADFATFLTEHKLKLNGEEEQPLEHEAATAPEDAEVAFAFERCHPAEDEQQDRQGSEEPSSPSPAPSQPSSREYHGPMPEASSRWWHARSDAEISELEVQDLLDVFCGEDRPGDLRDATIAAGGSASGVDTCLAGSAHNVADGVIFDALCRLISAGKVRHLWLGVVCSSLSQLWLKRGRPRLRSRQQPDGITPMPLQWRGYIARANQLIERAAWLAYIQWLSGGTYYIENPADVGFWASPHFMWSKRAAVSLWIVSYIRTLVEATNPVWGTTALCGWRGLFRKLTTVCAAGPHADPVITITDVQCTCLSHALVADGIDSEGRQLSRLAGQYPPLFCGFFGHNFTHDEPWYALEAASPSPVSDQLVSLINRQRPPPAMPKPYTELEAISQRVNLSLITASQWRSAHLAIPQQWPEHEDVTGPAFQAVMSEPLRFISRRRAEAELPERLAVRPMPQASVTPVTQPKQTYGPVEWPSGCPPRPISIYQLYYEGIYESILGDIDQVTANCQTGQRTGHAPKFESKVYKPEETQPEWARAVSWDTEDPFDCVPLQPNIDTPPEQGLDPTFFQEWGEKLKWTDKSMIHQVTNTGAEDGSTCTEATIINGHHKGLRDHFAEADKSIRADQANGFISAGRRHLRIVPSIMVPKNCVQRKQWKINELGELMRSIKWRVSTDDSIEKEGETSRNNGMDHADWEKPGMPTPRTLAEMVAITKSIADGMHLSATQFEMERIALWAFDLTHAYREVGIQRAEQGRQCVHASQA